MSQIFLGPGPQQAEFDSLKDRMGTVAMPSGNGTDGQLLKSNGDGTTQWTTQGTPTDAQVEAQVSAWLAAHPEATTTVEDGAISRAKLDNDLKEKTDEVPSLKSAVSMYRGNLETLAVTDLKTCLSPGWYSCRTVHVPNITDLPTGFPTNKGIILKVYDHTGNGSFLRQELAAIESDVYVRSIRSNGQIDIDWVKQSDDLYKLCDNIRGYEFTLTEGNFIYWDNGGAAGSSLYACTGFINISGCEKIAYSQIKAASYGTVNNGMAFYDSSKTYISGVMSSVENDKPGTQINVIPVPEGAVYARFTTWGSAYRADRGGFELYDGDTYLKNIEYNVKNNSANIKTNSEDIDILYKNTPYQNWEQGGLYFADGTYTTNSARIRTTDKLSIEKGYVSVQAINGYKMYVFAWDENGVYKGAYKGGGAFGNSSATVIMVEHFDMTLFPNYTYKFVARNADGTDITISNANNIIFKSIKGIVESTGVYSDIPLGLHTMPENQGVINAIKRCRQLTDIKWTPAVDLPRLMKNQTGWDTEDTVNDDYFEGVFKAGVEYTGIPYGRANDLAAYGYPYGYLGSYIPFETFATSVANPESMLCKESQFQLADHSSVLYAAVCSALVCYALNISYRGTSTIGDVLSAVGKLNDNGTLLDPNLLKLGQVLNWSGHHTAMITDIVKDGSENILAVELSEATVKGIADKNYADGQNGGLCIRKGWTLDDLYTTWGEFTVYNVPWIASIPYKRTSFVNVEGIEMFHITQMPIIPYQGEGFVFKSNYIPNTDLIISPNLGYSYLRVFKDGNEITGSPFAITSETRKYTVGFTETGEYKAYLSTMSNGHDVRVSYPCHWSVV